MNPAVKSTPAFESQIRDNHLLARLSAEAWQRLEPHFEVIELTPGRVLHEPDVEVHHAYFPMSGIVSLLTLTQCGASTETAMVGKEGLVGVALIMGGSTQSRAVVQNAGLAVRLPGRHLQDEFRQHNDLRSLMLRYMQSKITQMAQTAVCYRLHHIEEQLCRWMLLSLDRLADNEIRMTQEQIAQLLGVRREGVTEAAGKLQKAGAIEYRRGRITIVDRALLESLSCECYAVVKAESDRLMFIAGPGSQQPETDGPRNSRGRPASFTRVLRATGQDGLGV